MGPSGGGTSNHTHTEVFRKSLSELKQRGGNLLIVGSTHENVHRQVCLQMLGDPTTAPRRRLIVLGGSNGHTAAGSSALLQQSSSIEIINHSTQPRSAVSQENLEQPEISKKYTTSGKLSELKATILESMTRYEALAGGFSPAELRVCFDLLLSIKREYDRETVARFLRGITRKVQSFDGIGHFHLPVARDEPIVADLVPFFDAVVELRIKEKSPQQRWRLCDSGVESEWIPVPHPSDG